jgi:hypothetical protein
MKEVDSASKLANAEYEQALASIEFYKKGLDLRKNARMVGEKEYQDTLDALAELEIQKGIDREDAVQKAISEALPRVKDPAMREDLVGRMAESIQKEQALITKAYTDKALAQLKAQISQEEFLREIERVEAESFSNRLSAQEQFVKDWNAKNGELVQRAMVDGDMESFVRLKNAEANGREVARRSDAAELAGMFPDNAEAQMAALEARYLAERERMLALTKENLDLQHQLEMDLTSKYQMELAQLRLQGVQNFMSAGEQMTSAVAGLVELNCWRAVRGLPSDVRCEQGLRRGQGDDGHVHCDLCRDGCGGSAGLGADRPDHGLNVNPDRPDLEHQLLRRLRQGWYHPERKVGHRRGVWPGDRPGSRECHQPREDRGATPWVWSRRCHPRCTR